MVFTILSMFLHLEEVVIAQLDFIACNLFQQSFAILILCTLVSLSSSVLLFLNPEKNAPILKT